MVARIQDTHGGLNLGRSTSIWECLRPRLCCNPWAESWLSLGCPDEAGPRAAGLNVGDIILTIDGEPAEQRVAFLSKFKALSTPQSAYPFIVPYSAERRQRQQVLLRVEGVNGQIREIELTRTVLGSFQTPGSVSVPVPRKTPIYQTLPNGYGYIDLARLPLDDAHQALDAVMNTPAIIFDMRGYPNGTAWAIAPRLTEKKNFTTALFRRPIQSATAFSVTNRGGSAPDQAIEQKLPPAKAGPSIKAKS